MNTIRVIIDGPATGAWNMAADDALFESAKNGVATLRFYQWSPATISLGYFQPYDLRNQHLASADCDCVRRTTGGGAIVHDQELTYSIALPCVDRFSEATDGLYNLCHNSLIATLLAKGISATRCGCTSVEKDGQFLCFERRACGDVLLDGKKVAGSAQRRSGTGLLQHGSILLRQSLNAPELPGIAEISGNTMEIELFIADWLPMLLAALNLRGEIFTWDISEVEQAKQFAENRYSQPAWVKRR